MTGDTSTTSRLWIVFGPDGYVVHRADTDWEAQAYAEALARREPGTLFEVGRVLRAYQADRRGYVRPVE